MRSLLINISLSLATVLLCYAVGEAAFRILHLHSSPFVELNSCTGFKSPPYAQGWYVGQDFRTHFTMNAQGFYDVEHGAKEPDVYRVLMLGDSFIEGLQVPLSDTVSRQLQARFDAAGKKVEVISLGTTGFDTAQELKMYQCYGRAYQPDMVVLNFYDGNDVIDNIAPNPFSPSFTLTATGTLAFDPSYHGRIADRQKAYHTLYPGVIYWLKTHSELFLFLYDEVRTIEIKNQQKAMGIYAYNPIFLPQEPLLWQQAWQLTDALVTKLGDDVTADHARFVIATIAAPEQLTSSTTPGLNRPENELGAVARAHQWGFVDMRPAFINAESSGTTTHFAHDLHWNARGHALGADVLFSYLNAIVPK